MTDARAGNCGNVRKATGGGVALTCVYQRDRRRTDCDCDNATMPRRGGNEKQWKRDVLWLFSKDKGNEMIRALIYG